MHAINSVPEVVTWLNFKNRSFDVQQSGECIVLAAAIFKKNFIAWCYENQIMLSVPNFLMCIH